MNPEAPNPILPEDSEVRDFILSQLFPESDSDSTRMYGSQLGSRLKKQFPALNLKSRGGLVTFIQHLVGEQLSSVRQEPGGDVCFSRPNTNQSQNGTPISPDDTWRVFHNPKLEDQKLFWDTERQMLKAAAANAAVPQEWREVRRISTEVQNQLTREFAHLKFKETHGDEDAQKPWSQAMQADDLNLWPLFSIALRTQEALPQWLKFRWSRLRQLFVEALVEVGLDRELAQKKAETEMEMAASARKAKILAVAVASPTAKTSAESGRDIRSCSSPPSEARSVRNFVSQLVEYMSLEELEGVQVSVSTVWAYMNRGVKK